LPHVKISLSKVQCSHIATSPEGNIHNQIDRILIDRRRHSSVLDVRSFRAADCDTDRYLVVAMIRERLAVNKQGSYIFHMERFNLKKLSKAHSKENCRTFSQSVRWLDTANFVPSLPVPVNLKMEVAWSSEMPVFREEAGHLFLEDGILHSHYCENLKSYKQTKTNSVALSPRAKYTD
jgi:hypothetical protein